VFVRDSFTGDWGEPQVLTASDADPGDGFGRSVAIDVDTAVIGAPEDSEEAVFAGAAYIFVRNLDTGEWEEEQKLTGSDASFGDDFGRSVAIIGDTVVVGARDDEGNELFSGSAYVFVRNEDTGEWEELQKLTASDGLEDDEFGASVAIDDDTILVGAPRDDREPFAEDDFGAAYVFVFCSDTGEWEEQQKLTASDGAEEDEFGTSVALDGDTAWIGAPFDDEFDIEEADVRFDVGSAYIFARDPWTGAWTEQQKVRASDEAQDQEFGTTVAIDHDTAVIGAPEDDNFRGSAYIFVRDWDTGDWIEKQKLAASDRDLDDEFGQSVAISCGTVMVGAPFDDEEDLVLVENSGAAYVFVLVDCDGC
jgi:hypothetical protein